jgi:hypothetical protein
MKINQSPVACAAPVLRAREIWFSGSKTTSAPAERAISAVRSLELLSQTMISDVQPSRSKTGLAAAMLCSVPPSRASSLKAGMTMEIRILPI